MASGIDTVIFDMDGVIFDSEILVLQAWKEVAERHGIAGVEAACHECLGTNSVVSKGVFLKHYGEDFRCFFCIMQICNKFPYFYVHIPVSF